MGFFAHAQTVDTTPLFPPPTWPGYEATSSQSLELVHVRSLSIANSPHSVTIGFPVWLSHLKTSLLPQSLERVHMQKNKGLISLLTSPSPWNPSPTPFPEDMLTHNLTGLLIKTQHYVLEK